MWFIKKTEIKETKNHLIPDINFDDFKEVEQINVLIPYTKNPNMKIANLAAKAVNRIFISINDFNINQLYKAFKYLDITTNDIKDFKQIEQEFRLSLLCISTLNHNGYVREKALKELVKINSQRIIPFILFRLSDWVPVIKIKAEKEIMKFCKAKNTIFFIQNHKLINWLLKVERNKLTHIYSQIIQTITSTKLDLANIINLKEGERFFYYKTISNRDSINKNIFNLILNDNYSLIRFLVFKHLDENKSNSVMLKLLNDNNPRIRKNAITLLEYQDLSEYEKILKKLIFDTSSFVREEARILLSKVGDYDFNLLYKENLHNNKFVIGSILGLSEVSDKKTIPIIEKFLKSEKAKVISASLKGIYNLDEKIGIETAYLILENDNPSSSKKVAEKILAKTRIDYRRLRNLYDLSDKTGRKIILRLFSKFKNWSVAGDFLKALSDNDETIKLMAKSFLESWNYYTISLATKQTEFDREYVMTWYNKIKEKGIEVPNNIPFIFKEN